jgi:hypothetical protein
MSMTALRFFSGFGDGLTCAGIYGRNVQEGRNREHAVHASKASRQDNMKMQLTVSCFLVGHVFVTNVDGHVNILYFVADSESFSKRYCNL